MWNFIGFKMSYTSFEYRKSRASKNMTMKFLRLNGGKENYQTDKKLPLWKELPASTYNTCSQRVRSESVPLKQKLTLLPNETRSPVGFAFSALWYQVVICLISTEKISGLNSPSNYTEIVNQHTQKNFSIFLWLSSVLHGAIFHNIFKCTYI